MTPETDPSTTPPAGAADAQPAASIDSPAPADGAAILEGAATAGPEWPAWAPPKRVGTPTENLPPPAPKTFEQQIAALEQPAAAPSDYILPPRPGTEQLSDDDIADGFVEGQALQTLLHEAGFPAHAGSAVLEAAADAYRRNGGAELDDAALELRVIETERTLRRMYGDAEYDRRHQAMAKMFQRMDGGKGALEDFVAEHIVAFTDPMVVSRLMEHAVRAS